MQEGGAIGLNSIRKAGREVQPRRRVRWSVGGKLLRGDTGIPTGLASGFWTRTWTPKVEDEKLDLISGWEGVTAGFFAKTGRGQGQGLARRAGEPDHSLVKESVSVRMSP